MKNYNITRKCEILVENNLQEVSKLALEYRCYGICVKPELVDQAVSERAILGGKYNITAIIDHPDGLDNITTKISDVQDLVTNADELDIAVLSQHAELSSLLMLIGWSNQNLTLSIANKNDYQAILNKLSILYRSGASPDYVRISTSLEAITPDEVRSIIKSIKSVLPISIKIAGCYDIDTIRKIDAVFYMGTKEFKKIKDIDAA